MGSCLTEQRYITIKLYYTDETPEDYEPVSEATFCTFPDHSPAEQPHFGAVDYEQAKFTMGTKDPEAKPEMEVVGRVDSGHHWYDGRSA